MQHQCMKYYWVTKMEDDKINLQSIQHAVDNISHHNNQLGIEVSTAEILAKLDLVCQELNKKSLELDAISFLAFHSNEPGIVELRKELFMMVKLCHNNEVNKLVEELGDYLKYADNCSMPSTTSYNTNNKNNRNIINLLNSSSTISQVLEKFSGWVTKNKNIKRKLFGANTNV